MIFSDNFSQLAQTLQDAGDSDAQLRLTLLHHFSELIQQLTCPLVADPSQAQEGLCFLGWVRDSRKRPGPFGGCRGGSLVLSEYGDAFPHGTSGGTPGLRYATFGSRGVCSLLAGCVFGFWGRPLLVCKAATLDGSRRILGFAECGLRDSLLLEQLFRDFLDRGLDLASGLDSQRFGAGMLAIALRGNYSRIWYHLGCLGLSQYHTKRDIKSHICRVDVVSKNPP